MSEGNYRHNGNGHATDPALRPCPNLFNYTDFELQEARYEFASHRGKKR